MQTNICRLVILSYQTLEFRCRKENIRKNTDSYLEKLLWDFQQRVKLHWPKRIYRASKLIDFSNVIRIRIFLLRKSVLNYEYHCQVILRCFIQWSFFCQILWKGREGVGAVNIFSFRGSSKAWLKKNLSTQLPFISGKNLFSC